MQHFFVRINIAWVLGILGSVHTELLAIALALAVIAKNRYSTQFLHRYH